MSSDPRNPTRRPAIIAAASLCIASACSPADSPPSGAVGDTVDGWGGTVDTLPSGRVVITNPDRPLWTTAEGWTLRELFRVGSLEGEHDAFGEIRDLELGPDGSLYVLDGQADDIRVFGPDGARARTIGRQGEGPGELNAAAGMAWGPDERLWVMSWRNNRYTAFDPLTGELAAEHRRLASFASFPWPGAFAAGSLIDMGLRLDTPHGTPVLLRLDTAFVPRDTLPIPQPDENSRVAFRHDGVLMMTMMDPFAASPAWAPHPRGGIVVGEGKEYRLHRIGFDGDTTMTIEILREPVPISASERDSALAAFRERTAQVMENGMVPDRDPRVPDVKPAHGGLFIDDRDRIWVFRANSPVPSWDVIAADGRFLGSVSAISGTRAAVRNGRLAMATSEGGVPAVVVYDIVGAEGRDETPTGTQAP